MRRTFLPSSTAPFFNTQQQQLNILTFSRRFAAAASSAATSTQAGGSSSTTAAAAAPPFHFTELGLTEKNCQALYACFKNTQNPRSFIPPTAIIRQCKYTAHVARQLARQAKQGRAEKWLPASCLDSNGNLVESRFIVATAFDDRKQSKQHNSTSQAASSSSRASTTTSAGGSSSLQLELTRTEQMQCARRLAVEHFNWSYYWRSLAFDGAANSVEAAGDFADLVESKCAGSLAEFFNNGSANTQAAATAATTMSAIKSKLREYALHGGAATQGGSWTWLVWNPVSGTSFSASNRYGVEGGISSAAAGKPEPAGENKKDEAKGDATAAEEKTPKKQETASAAASNILVAGRLEVINTPFDVCPLDYGLFPILCINMTQRCTLATPIEWATVPIGESAFAGSSSSPPSWSRAARNPESIVTRTATLPKPGFQAFESAEEQRQRFVDGIVFGTNSSSSSSNAVQASSHLNWRFAAQQLHHALEWNTSAERAELMRAQAQAAWDAAEARIQAVLDRKVADESSGAGLDSATLQEEAAAAAAAAEQEQQQQQAAQEKQQQQQQAHSEKKKPDETKTSAPTSPASATTTAAKTVTPTVGTDGSLVYQYPDRTEYHFQNGKKTVVKAGVTEWYEAATSSSSDPNSVKMTRQHTATGTMEYFYNSGVSIEMNPQLGKKITRFPDGRSMEESLVQK